MSFVSTIFLVFLAALFLTYFCIPMKFRWMVLLAGSYVFYMYAGAQYVFYLIATTASVFFVGLAIGKTNDHYETVRAEKDVLWSQTERNTAKAHAQKVKKLLMLAGIIFNFAILAFVKYFDFAATNINSVLAFFGFGAGLKPLGLVLPLGLSFYIFQAAGYVLDVYNDRVKPDRNFFKFALFLSFFPQIVQGPIARYGDLAHQLYTPHRFDATRCLHAFELILWGFFRKLVIADRLAPFIGGIFANSASYDGLILVIGVFGYGLQLYCDFAGGIDIARGIAQFLGINMAENFKQPYFAVSMADFWRRWHITLGSWMRDYVFFPMALSKTFTKLGKNARHKFGNEIGKVIPPCIISFIVFFIIGVWHGASWRYVIYGLYNAAVISFSVLMMPAFNTWSQKIKLDRDTLWWRIVSILRTILLVSLGRCLAVSDNLSGGLQFIGRIFSSFSLNAENRWTLLNLGLGTSDFIVVFAGILILLFAGILHEHEVKIRQAMDRWPMAVRWTFVFCAVFAVLIFGVYGYGYDDSSFIYRNF